MLILMMQHLRLQTAIHMRRGIYGIVEYLCSGQQHIIGKDKLLYRAIKADKISSLIFYGPPGTGKTTLAKVIANTTSANFVQMNATTSGKKDMEQAVSQAKDAFGMYGKRTILFIDEIHRFNKAQQDYLLPFVEDGTVILIGGKRAIICG